MCCWQRCFKRKEGLLDKRVLGENWARERSKGATGQPRKKRTRGWSLCLAKLENLV